ncbi:MAG: MFS transporter [Thiobacillaceae bacterium]|nr:MFS transporter [Thiobacillaceae bacterium]
MRPWLNRTVAGAGITSALGDLCYETAQVILPGFLAVLGIPAAALGLIEGVADAVASLTKLAAGHIADRLGQRKRLVLLGYALTPLGQGLIALAAGWPMILLGRVLAWFGKGLRGPLRDAIVLQAVDPALRGRAFGFHRAADTVGAVLGPLTGVALLELAQSWPWAEASGPFRLVLWFTLLPGLLAVIAFALMVHDPGHVPNPRLRLAGAWRDMPIAFRRYAGAVALFGAGDYSHVLLILAATTLLTPALGAVEAAQLAGLMYVLRNLVQMGASYPVGWLADRLGHRRVLAVGYALGAGSALALALAFAWQVASVAALAAIFVLAGLYMAVQEALESTVSAEFIPRERLTTGLGALGFVNGLTRFFSSAMVGLLWTAVSGQAAFALAAGLMLTGTVLLVRVRR